MVRATGGPTSAPILGDTDVTVLDLASAALAQVRT
jgi:hypothetical protein